MSGHFQGLEKRDRAKHPLPQALGKQPVSSNKLCEEGTEPREFNFVPCVLFLEPSCGYRGTFYIFPFPFF